MTKSELRSLIREVLHEEVVKQHSDDVYSVVFEDSSEHPLFTGTKEECDDLVKQIKDSPWAKRHGVKVSKGAEILVDKK